MALALEGQIANSHGNAAAFTVVPTLPSGADLFEIYVIWRDNTVTLDTVQEDGDDVSEYQNEVGTTMGGLAVFYVLAPSAGSHTYTLTFSGATDYYCGVRAWSGARQEDPPFEGWVAAEANTDTPTGTLVGSISKFATDLVAVDIGATPLPTATVGTGQTSGANSLDNDLRSLSSYKRAAASSTMYWTLSAAAQWLGATYNVLHAYKGSTATITIPPVVTGGTVTRNPGKGVNHQADFSDTLDQEVEFA